VNKLKALPGTVIVTPGDLARTANGDQCFPGTGIITGRQVDPPWATVLASADDEVSVGARVVAVVDRTECHWRFGPGADDAMDVQRLCTSRVASRKHWLRDIDGRHKTAQVLEPLRVGLQHGSEEVIAVMVDDTTMRAIGTRVVGRVAEDAAPSETIAHLAADDAHLLRLDVTSTGRRAHGVAVGDRVTARRVDAHVWTQAGTTWASVRSRDVRATEERQGPAGAAIGWGYQDPPPAPGLGPRDP